MQVTIIIEARDVPCGTRVRKPTGAKFYTLRRNGINIWTEIDGGRVEVIGADHLHLQGEEHIQMIGANMKVAIDFERTRDAIEFLEWTDEERD